MNNKNCYLILHLKSDASKKDIKQAYRRLATLYHPDKPTGDASKFRVIKQAYDQLMKAPEASTSTSSAATAKPSSGFGTPRIVFVTASVPTDGYYYLEFMASEVKSVSISDEVEWEIPHNKAYSRELINISLKLDVKTAREFDYKLRISLKGVNGLHYDMTAPVLLKKPRKKSKLADLFNNIW